MSVEAAITVTPGTGASVDVFNSGTGGASRQCMVIGDPATAANVATVNSAGQVAVQGTGTVGSAAGNTAAVVGGQDGSGIVRVLTASVFHNADNQALTGTSYGQLTGGVAQLLNVAGNLDRQRETGEDGIPANGISASAANFAMAFKTSIALAITANASPQAVTPGAMSGTINGVPWSIQQGSTLSIDTGTNQEYVYVTSVTSTTFSAVFGKSHGTNSKVGGFVYNQERDAAGEADGAAGIGTAVAAEYEFNGGGPGGGSFDRARNLQGKGKTSQTISAGGTQGSLSLTIGANTGLKAGMQVLLATASFPTSGSYEAVYVDLSYVEGTNTVPLLSAIQLANTYTTVYYDAFSADGPGLNGFLPIGVGIEEEALYDPVTGLYFVERAATTDACAPQNVVIENPGLFNGATIDRQRAAPGTTGVAAVSSDGTKATYRASGVGLTPAAACTDFITITGSGSKTVRLKSIRLSGIATTAGAIPVQLIRRSAANTAGASSAATAVKHDINDGAASAAVAVYSANPTGLGTAVGAMATDRLFLNLSTAAPLPVVRDFAIRQDKAAILRGTTDIIAINFGGNTIPSGGAVDYEIEWEEDNS